MMTLDEYRDMVSRFDWRVVYADLYPDYDASEPDYFARCTERDYSAGEGCWAFQPEVRHHPDCDVYQAEIEVYGIESDVDPGDYTCHCDNE